eukprot:6035764-Ditylum_brightwellii.AAC.1
MRRKWSIIPEESKPPTIFKGHFHKCELTITTAHNVHNKISGKFQLEGTASITTGNIVGRLDGKGGRDPPGLG